MCWCSIPYPHPNSYVATYPRDGIRRWGLWDMIRSQGGSPGGSSDKESAYNAGDTVEECSGSGLGRSSGGGHGNSLQYSCWEIPRTGEPGWLRSMVLQSQTRQKWLSKQAQRITNGISALVKQAPESFLSFLLCEFTTRRQPSMN